VELCIGRPFSVEEPSPDKPFTPERNNNPESSSTEEEPSSPKKRSRPFKSCSPSKRSSPPKMSRPFSARASKYGLRFKLPSLDLSDSGTSDSDTVTEADNVEAERTSEKECDEDDEVGQELEDS
jgi:hypothetical protein